MSPAGSHKPNTAVAQAFYNKEAGIKKIATETGAGQWGSALAFAGATFGVEILVFMVRVSHNQKPYRRAFSVVALTIRGATRSIGCLSRSGMGDAVGLGIAAVACEKAKGIPGAAGVPRRAAR